MLNKAKTIASFTFCDLRNCIPDSRNNDCRAEGTAGGAQAKRQRSAVPVACWTAGTGKEILKIFFLNFPALAKCCGLPSFPRFGQLHSLRTRPLGGLRYAMPTLRSLACHSFSLPHLVGTRPCTYPRREPMPTLGDKTALFPNDFVGTEA
jgi:hypothetical protein